MTSPSSSSFLLKSILNVSVAQVTPSVTPQPRRQSREAPPPLSAVQKNNNNIAPYDTMKEKDRVEYNETAVQQNNKLITNDMESGPGSVQKTIPIGTSANGNNGNVLVPSSVRIHFIGKKSDIPERVLGSECSADSEKKISSPSLPMTSVPNPISIPLKSENNNSSYTPSSSSMSASASLLEALSIVPKCSSPLPVAKQNVPVQVPVSIPVSLSVSVPVGDVVVPRRMSVSQLFQTQPTPARAAPAATTTVTTSFLQNTSVQQVQHSMQSGRGIVTQVEVPMIGTNTNNRVINRIPLEQVFQSSVIVSDATIAMSQSKENMTKSESLFSMLKLLPKDAESTDPVKFIDSKQSKAMPGVEQFFISPSSLSSLSSSVPVGTETAGSKTFRNVVNAEYTSSVKSSATPSTLGYKTDRADSKHVATINTNMNTNTQPSALPLSTRYTPASFFASSSNSVTPNPPLCTSPPTFPLRVPTHTASLSGASQVPLHTDTVPHRLPLGLTSSVPLYTPAVDRRRSTPSPPSLTIKSAPSEYEYVTPLSGTSLQGSLAQNGNGNSALSHILGPPKIPDQVQGPVPTQMKFLSPSDLTGYIRKF